MGDTIKEEPIFPSNKFKRSKTVSLTRQQTVMNENTGPDDHLRTVGP